MGQQQGETWQMDIQCPNRHLKSQLTLMPSTVRTPYWNQSPHTSSRITVLRPGHRPPHVTMAARTSEGWNTIWSERRQ